nr:methyltransferase [Methylobacterium brachythecii]
MAVAGMSVLQAGADLQTEFPRVDRFLDSEIATRALACALELGLIDRLAGSPTLAKDGLAAEYGIVSERFGCLADLLIGAGVLAEVGDARLALTDDFSAVLPFRDLIDAKIGFAMIAAEDLRGQFNAFLTDLPAFMAESRTFELFRYDRCFEARPDNIAATRRWVSYTTCLTRYEAGPCLDRIDLGGHSRMLDLGGNSGEFASQACRRAPHLQATVVDLPVVCRLGRDHLAGRAEAERVTFHAADMRRDPLPAGHDLVTFKSVLHDWPAADARLLLERAIGALAPGGRLVIYERAPMPLRERALGFSQMADLVFQPFFRDAGLYMESLTAFGLCGARHRVLDLGTPFHLIDARKPAEIPVAPPAQARR